MDNIEYKRVAYDVNTINSYGQQQQQPQVQPPIPSSPTFCDDIDNVCRLFDERMELLECCKPNVVDINTVLLL
jgi:hypothetical protein